LMAILHTSTMQRVQTTCPPTFAPSSHRIPWSFPWWTPSWGWVPGRQSICGSIARSRMSVASSSRSGNLVRALEWPQSPVGDHSVTPRPVFIFDLDGTLVDSVYEHVLSWQEALDAEGIELSVWRIHRKIGMSGGLFTNQLLRETKVEITEDRIERLRR